MRYGQEHKAKTRRKILKAAARLFREFGYDGVGVDAIMAEAGLTAGGFYAHFPSKRALFDEALATATATAMTGSNATRAVAKSARADEAGQLRLTIENYLSRQHRERVADGCPLPALTPDAARGGETSRENYERQLLQYVNRLEALLPAGVAARSDVALALMAQCVGGLMLARAVKDERLSDRILKASRRAALKLGEE
ncbi:MAG: TetR/AcrR family transcriptional regulator [Acidobacteria bacterium]|nr:TetR/AcrR family transcriptional regulator [Acidobacteriota bacterium]